MSYSVEKEISILCEEYSTAFIKSIWMSDIIIVKDGIVVKARLPKKITETIDDWKFKVMKNGIPISLGVGLTFNELIGRAVFFWRSE